MLIFEEDMPKVPGVKHDYVLFQFVPFDPVTPFLGKHRYLKAEYKAKSTIKHLFRQLVVLF